LLVIEWKDAIITVLRDAKEPMHYAEIAAQIAQRSLREDLGATPPSTVVSIITTSLKNDGDKSPFFRTSRGYYSEQQAPVLEQESEAETSEASGLVNAFGMFWDKVQGPMGITAQDTRATTNWLWQRQFR